MQLDEELKDLIRARLASFDVLQADPSAHRRAAVAVPVVEEGKGAHYKGIAVLDGQFRQEDIRGSSDSRRDWRSAAQFRAEALLVVLASSFGQAVRPYQRCSDPIGKRADRASGGRSSR